MLVHIVYSNCHAATMVGSNLGFLKIVLSKMQNIFLILLKSTETPPGQFSLRFSACTDSYSAVKDLPPRTLFWCAGIGCTLH